MPSDVLFLNSQTLFGPRERLSNAAPRLSFSSNRYPPRLSASTSIIDPPRFSASARIDPSRLSSFSKSSFDPPRTSSSITTSLGVPKVTCPRSSSTRIDHPCLSFNLRNEPARVPFSRNSDAASPRLSSASRSPLPRASAHSTSIDVGSSSTPDARGRIDLEIGNMESSAARCSSSSSSKLSTVKGSRPEGDIKGLIERHAMLLRKAFASGTPDSDGALLTPSYQRSLSEFSGMERYVDSRKNLPNVRDEKTRKWFSIARKTLNWMTGSDRSKTNLSRGQSFENS